MRRIILAQMFLLPTIWGGLYASAATATGAAEPPAAVALVSVGHNQVEWTPLGDFESISLALADPQGLVRLLRFGSGEAPVLSLFDAQGMPLPDGTHTWELRVTPRRSAGRPVAPLVQSGYFTISNGNLVPPDLTEPPEKIITAEDQVVPDDLIVDGKGCIGLGCANNEAFFSEALRLKQSVIRLRFVDTSVAAGLPTSDWQLTINDAASGGADRFSIEDLTAGTTPFTVRGGAPSNSLYVDGAGKVGVGTATPGRPFEVARAGAVEVAFLNSSSTHAGGGAAPPTRWFFQVDNDPTRTFKISREGTGGTEVTIGKRLDADGATLKVDGSVQATNVIFTSSRDFKEDFQPLDPQEILARTVQLPISEWTFKEGPKVRHIGPMAEDFNAAFGLGIEKTISLTDVSGVALAAIQGLHSLVEEQRQFIEKQQELIGRLEERLRRLEAEKNPKQLAVVDQR